MEGTEYSIDSGSYVAPSGGVAERAADASDSSWQAIVDSATGSTYYFNTLTQLTSWINPNADDASITGNAVPSQSEAPLPEPPAVAAAPLAMPPPVPSAAEEATAAAAHSQSNLVSAVDPATGRTYYYNQSTGETTWAPYESNDNTTAPAASSSGSVAGASSPQILRSPSQGKSYGDSDDDAANGPRQGIRPQGSARVDLGEVNWSSGGGTARPTNDMTTAMSAEEEARLVPRGPRAPTIDATSLNEFGAAGLSAGNPLFRKNSSGTPLSSSSPPTMMLLPGSGHKSSTAEAGGAASASSTTASGGAPAARRKSSKGFGSLAMSLSAATRALGGGGSSQSHAQSGGATSTQPPPPAAAVVPVDALARAGERSNRWLEYVKKHLLATDHVQDAGIFDLRNCARWAASLDFLPRHYHVLDSHEVLHGVNEAASTVFLMKSGQMPRFGLRFNGVRYELEHITSFQPSHANGLARWAVSGTKALPPEPSPSVGTSGNNNNASGCNSAVIDPHWQWSGGIYLVRTSRAVVIATWCTQKGHSQEVCRAAVDGLAKFMTDYAC